MKSPDPKPSKYLIAFVGPVGSGKTYLAKRLARRLEAVHINTDAIRVRLRRHDQSMSRAISIANRLRLQTLSKGRSVISDFDAILPRRQAELKRLAERFGAKFILIRVKTPERLILARLKQKRYTASDLFRNAGEAIRIYFLRKKFHRKHSRFTSGLTIDNSKLLGQQIDKIVKSIKGP